jgi:hypothetical protein
MADAPLRLAEVKRGIVTATLRLATCRAVAVKLGDVALRLGSVWRWQDRVPHSTAALCFVMVG